MEKMIKYLPIHKLYFLSKKINVINYHIYERLKDTVYENIYQKGFSIFNIYNSIKKNMIIVIDEKTVMKYCDFLKQVCEKYNNHAAERVLKIIRKKRCIDVDNVKIVM